MDQRMQLRARLPQPVKLPVRRSSADIDFVNGDFRAFRLRDPTQRTPRACRIARGQAPRCRNPHCTGRAGANVRSGSLGSLIHALGKPCLKRRTKLVERGIVAIVKT